jgi:predicted exporter
MAAATTSRPGAGTVSSHDRKMSARQGWLLVAALAVLAGLGWLVDDRLVVGTDLRLFMPSPRTDAERLVLDEIGEGPASRMLLLAIRGDDRDAVAETSRRLATALRASERFRFVANGETDADAIPERFLPYRYLLSPTLDTRRFDATMLHEALAERTRDLTSPAAALLEPWVMRDPTLETLALAESWMPRQQPQLWDGVWFDSAGREALLVVATTAAGFDPQSQREAQGTLRRTFADVRVDPGLQLDVSGPGAFTVLMQERTQRDAQWIGTFDTVGIVTLLLVAYRSLLVLGLCALPLVSGGLVGLAAVALGFGSVHAITIAFGFTLIGVAQDYPVHLFSHRHPGQSPHRSARALWPTLATGVASTCVAYVAFFFSGVRGLEQLAVFTISGLATAGLVTRFLLPELMPGASRDAADSAILARLWRAIASLPRPRWLAPAIAVGCVGYLALSSAPLWQNSLGGLMPVPRPLIERDTALRRSLGAPDVRYLLAIEGSDSQAVLRRSADVAQALDAAVQRGELGAYDHPARYLPPTELQRSRQDTLPAPERLRIDLHAAVSRTEFRADAFEPFLQDVERARSLPPLGPDALAGTPLESRVGSLLLHNADHWTGLVTLTDVRDPAALAAVAHAVPGATFLDLKAASEGLVAGQRERILACLAVATVLLVAVVAIALRKPARIGRVLAPMALTTVLIVAILHLCGVALSLFHLIALVLAAGLGLDYALFFEHAADDPGQQRRTLHAVIVCSLSTWMVFALLATSAVPVLRAIGVTVAIGVACNFVLALALTRPRPGVSPGR